MERKHDPWQDSKYWMRWSDHPSIHPQMKKDFSILFTVSVITATCILIAVFSLFNNL